MIKIKNKEEIELLRESNLLVGKTLGEMSKLIKPGVSTLHLDKVAEEFIRSHGAIPGFLGYGGFPNTLCVSLNSKVVHGIPSAKEILKEGDIVSIDCGVLKNGFYGDSAYTFAVGEIDAAARRLLETTKESLYLGIEQARIGRRLGDLGYAVQSHCEKQGFSVVREMVGHGVGRNLHEDPQVANYGRRGQGVQLREGMVIAIEPMINMGKRHIFMEDDDWTIKTKDGALSAHFEHTVAITKDGPDILSSFDFII